MRETKTVTIPDGDRELTFDIKPMGGVQAEKWLIRAALACGGSLTSLSSESNATDVVKALLSSKYEEVAPLWDELLKCCQLRLDNGATLPLSESSLDGKIDYPTTIIALKTAALQANFGFFGNGGFARFLTVMRSVLS